MTKEKIYIKLLDGVTAWVPVDALKISHGQHQILVSNDFTDFTDSTEYIFGFWPGDIVETDAQTFSDGQSGLTATRLIESGNWPDRKLREFKFKATLEQLSPDLETAKYYRDEISRIKNEIAKGEFNYDPVLDYIRIFYTISDIDGRAST